MYIYVYLIDIRAKEKSILRQSIYGDVVTGSWQRRRSILSNKIQPLFQQTQRNHFHAANRNPVLCDDDTLRCPPPKSIVILANTPTTNDADFTNKTNMIHSCSEGATNSLKLQSRSKGHASLIANAICQDNNISPF